MAALGFVVLDHGHQTIAVVLWCIATIVFVVGVAAAVLDVRADRQRVRADAEQRRRAAIIDQLRRQFRETYPTQWIGSLLSVGRGNPRLPKAWVDEQLEKMGETWRQDSYQ